jgi:hypothetical protein
MFFRIVHGAETGNAPAILRLRLDDPAPRFHALAWTVDAMEDSSYRLKERQITRRLRPLQERLSTTVAEHQQVLTSDTLENIYGRWPRFRVRVSWFNGACEGSVEATTYRDPSIRLLRIFQVPGRKDQIGVFSFIGIPVETGYEVQVPLLLPRRGEVATASLAESPLSPPISPAVDGRGPNKTICVFVDRDWIGEEIRTPFLRGLRRPFLLPTLPLECEGPKGVWNDAGSIPNAFHLSSSPCLSDRAADSLRVVSLAPDNGGSTRPADHAVRIRIKGWFQMSIDYLWRPGDPPPTPEQEIDPIGVSLQVAVCPPESVAADVSLAWTPIRVTWRENPNSSDRAQEIHGWMVGMAALQVLCRRTGVLPDSLDLVFESHGRNR